MRGFPGGLIIKNLSAKAKDTGSIPGSGRSGEREWQPTPLFLPGKSHVQRGLAGYSPWGQKASDTTQRLINSYDGKLSELKMFVTHSCPPLCDPMDWSLPGSSVHGILQARILEWAAVAPNLKNGLSRSWAGWVKWLWPALAIRVSLGFGESAPWICCWVEWCHLWWGPVAHLQEVD